MLVEVKKKNTRRLMYYILFIKFKLSASNNSQVHKYKKTTCENETEKCRIYLFTVLRSVDLPSL